MRLAEDIKPVSYLKTKSAELIEHVNSARRPVVITQDGEPRAVVLDVESYEALRDAALLLKLVSQGEAEAREGRTIPQREAFSRARQRIRSR